MVKQDERENVVIPKSGVPGVRWSIMTNKWIVRIKVRDKAEYLGSFNDFFEACCARKSAEARRRTP